MFRCVSGREVRLSSQAREKCCAGHITQPSQWEWKGLNTRFFVVVQAPKQDVMVLIMALGEGNDPLDVARAVEAKTKSELLKNARTVKIGKLDAVRSKIGARSSEGDIGLDFTWIAHGGIVYQIVGMSSLEGFKDYAETFKEVAWSFRPLSKAERAKITEARLRIVRARGGETLKGRVKRVNGAWTPAQTAVANATEQNVRLRGGQLVKVPVSEPYRKGKRGG